MATVGVKGLNTGQESSFAPVQLAHICTQILQVAGIEQSSHHTFFSAV